MHSTWDVEDKLDKEEEADKVAVEDVANARHSQTTCKVKVDVATTGVSQLHQEGQE